MTRARLIGCALIGFALFGTAVAEEAYAAKDVNLRAGPGRDYPLVARIPAGSSVEVAGCLNDYAWCDVIAGPDRGWAYSGSLEYPYEGRRVYILQEGPVIGLPIVTFSVGSYWDNYYRGRPWYGRRSYWVRRPVPQHRVWVRPSGPRTLAARPPVVVRPGARPYDNRPSGARPYQPRAARPAPHPVQVQPSHPIQPRPQARPQTIEQRKAPRQVQPQQQKGRQGQPHKDKKDGRGGQ